MVERGHTTLVVPRGEGLTFEGPAGRKMSEIKDGTSNTVVLVEMAPSQAVVWTKPDDWDVDSADPFSRLTREGRDVFAAGYADGHVQAISTKNDPALLRALLTPAGKEDVDFSSLK